MNAPLIVEGGDLSASLLAALAIGAGFGFALERAGLGSARKLVAQFFGRDLTVLKVMFSALLVAMLGVFWLGRFGLLDVRELHVPPTFLMPQLIGGLLFGFGLVLAGLCPGTACVSAATGRIDGALVLLGMLVGMLGIGLVLAPFSGFYLSTARGAWTLPDLLGWSYGTVVAMIVLLALGVFGIVEWLERRLR